MNTMLNVRAKKMKKKLCLLQIVSALALVQPVLAQTATENHAWALPVPPSALTNLQPLAASPPWQASWYSLQRYWFPPMPYNWLAEDATIPIYFLPALGTNILFLGDFDVNYAALDAQVRDTADGGRMTLDPDSGPGPAYDYSTNEFYLEII